MLTDMPLRGLAVRTQETYIRANERMAHDLENLPEKFRDDELRRYFLHLVNEKQVSESYITNTLSSPKFLFKQTLNRDWPHLPPRGLFLN